MMNRIWPTRMYEFLSFIQKIDIDRKILDCGAGGPNPPLALFAEKGYDCFGIDISNKAVESAMSFAEIYGVELDLKVGDMRNIPFDDDYFNFVYTQNTICHLSKADQKIAIDEMVRVLQPNGVLYIDFMSTESSYCGSPDLGIDIGTHEYQYVDEDGEDVLHVFFDDDEPDAFFENAKIVRKLKVLRKLSIPRESEDVWYYYYVTK